MGSILRYFGHLLMAMIKGFVFTALASGIVLAAWFTFVAHHGPGTIAEGLSAVIVVLAGGLGAAVALIWRLTHISEIAHAVKHIANPEEAAREDARKHSHTH